ncbi:MAG: C-terminal helicase domain-containing protein, partial [Proteobacteria bacterium]|nr:C-terminal helicase domain-containing protein [Pseudomonadota bacterium]
EEFDRSAGQVVLLMTQKVGGVGLNLTRASYVFHLEPWWNPAVENQATDRVHRMGQTKSVQVYRYIMEHSVEEKIQLLKNYKGQLFDALLSESEGDASTEQAAFKSAALSRADFEFLLS